MKTISRRTTKKGSEGNIFIFFWSKCPHCRKKIYIDFDIDFEKEEITKLKITKG